MVVIKTTFFFYFFFTRIIFFLFFNFYLPEFFNYHIKVKVVDKKLSFIFLFSEKSINKKFTFLKIVYEWTI